jgi:hypothetical protein
VGINYLKFFEKPFGPIKISGGPLPAHRPDEGLRIYRNDVWSFGLGH